MILKLFQDAVKKFGGETGSLRWLPDNRYNRRLFPTVGQYDWFDGQLLYCLVRLLRPHRVVEISMSSGYTTTFTASALRSNDFGQVFTFELDRRCVRTASRNFKRWELTQYISIYDGDARITCQGLPDGPPFSILFLDSLHTEGFARWFIEKFVLPAPPDALFHVHDVLPPGTAKMDIPARYKHEPIVSLGWSMRDPLRFFRHSKAEIEDWTEETFIHQLADRMKPDEYGYLYSIAEQFPELNPREYDHTAVGRADMDGKPRELNQSFWCFAGAVKRVYPSIPRRSK